MPHGTLRYKRAESSAAHPAQPWTHGSTRSRKGRNGWSWSCPLKSGFWLCTKARNNRETWQSKHHPACQRSASIRYRGVCLYSQHLVGETEGSGGQVRPFWVTRDPVLKKTRQAALPHTPKYSLLYNLGSQRRQHLLLTVIFNLTGSIHLQKVIFLWRIIGNDYLTKTTYLHLDHFLNSTTVFIKFVL